MGVQAVLATQGGYNLARGPVSIRPSVGASYTFLRQDSYTEEGGGDGVDLAIDANNFQSLRTTAELRFGGNFGGNPAIAPYVRGGITHEFLDATPVADGHFVAGGAFSLEGDPLDKDIPFAGAGFGIGSGYARLNLDYTGQFGDKLTSHQATATFVMKF
jgi:outer membrane autotransporter protein